MKRIDAELIYIKLHEELKGLHSDYYVALPLLSRYAYANSRQHNLWIGVKGINMDITFID